MVTSLYFTFYPLNQTSEVTFSTNIENYDIIARFIISLTWSKKNGETVETVPDFILGGSKITADGDCSHEIKRHSLKERYDQSRQHIQKQRHYFANKCPSSQGYGFSCGHVWMWELDCEESWAPKDWCFWTVVLEKTLESPLDCKEIQPVHSKGDQPWLFFGRNDAKADTLYPPSKCAALKDKLYKEIWASQVVQ